MKKLLLSSALLALTVPAIAQESHPDISFVPIGKAVNLRQHVDGDLEVLNYHFYAELFIKEGGNVTDGTFTGNGKTVLLSALIICSKSLVTAISPAKIWMLSIQTVNIITILKPVTVKTMI
ncbi:MAG: hypothetical protein P8J14_09625 [Emcibacteraceae bacterium]|nr:hypothetical protein [Emcibacteraceae bacterium]